jgi:hypothetical protein
VLGDLSAKYESNGDPGCVAHTPGDLGGASYGAYQFATASGIPQDFIRWLLGQGYANAEYLANSGEPGSSSFDEAWQKTAEVDAEEFLRWQWQYVKEHYFDVAMGNLRDAGWCPDKWPEDPMHQIVWSAAVHYGPKWIVDLIVEAYDLKPHPSTQEFIQAIYEVRSLSRNKSDWISTSNPEDIVEGLRTRMINECNDALAMLG